MTDNASHRAVQRMRGAIRIVERMTRRATRREQPEIMRRRFRGLVLDLLVADGATGLLRRIMALHAVAVGGRPPTPVVTLWGVVLVAAQATVLFMTRRASLPLPCRAQSVALPTPRDRMVLGRVLPMALLA